MSAYNRKLLPCLLSLPARMLNHFAHMTNTTIPLFTPPLPPPPLQAHVCITSYDLVQKVDPALLKRYGFVAAVHFKPHQALPLTTWHQNPKPHPPRLS